MAEKERQAGLCKAREGHTMRADEGASDRRSQGRCEHAFDAFFRPAEGEGEAWRYGPQGKIATSDATMLAIAASRVMSMFGLTERTDPSTSAKLMAPEWKLAMPRLHGLFPFVKPGGSSEVYWSKAFSSC